MNRRHFLLATLAPLAAPVWAAAQTPVASPTLDDATTVDTRARELAGLLQTISPVQLVAALQTTAVELRVFGDARLTPWADFSDTDLHSSLGGAVILTGSGDINDPESEMLGGYIVYESADIAYDEFVRKLGSAYENPSMSTTAGGTTVWILESDDMQIGTTRIGNVMLLANMSAPSGPATMDALIDHLIYVVARLDT